MSDSERMNQDDLNWRVEEACREAWPAAVEAVVHGWLLRRSGGRIRRPNSVNPLRGQRGAPVEVIDAAEAFYAGHAQTPLFRVPDLAAELEPELERRGYSREGGTIHINGEIDVLRGRRDDITVSPTPTESWFAARFRTGGYEEAECRIFRQMTSLIVGDRAFVSCERGGEVAAFAFGVIRNRLLVLEAVETDARFRQQGLGRRTVGGLIGWAREAGAKAGCLQVVADNVAGRALYASLGFNRELYRYHYRRKPHEPR